VIDINNTILDLTPAYLAFLCGFPLPVLLLRRNKATGLVLVMVGLLALATAVLLGAIMLKDTLLRQTAGAVVSPVAAVLMGLVGWYAGKWFASKGRSRTELKSKK
jgi:hypothetical protein